MATTNSHSTAHPADLAGVAGLVVHAAAIRRLARHLVRDDATADDVAQETMRVALERRPEGGWPVASWLAGVTNNVARNLRRGERRRVAREAAVARPEGEPSTADAIARVEQHRRVAQAVLALPEPFRTSIAMRYFDGLAPRAIARRTNVPVATVRSRVRRGIELLRVELDQRHGGDRRAWVVALVPLARRSPSSWLADALGGIAMSAGAKVAIGAAVGVLGLLALWRPWMRADDGAPPVAEPTPPPKATADGSSSLDARPAPVAAPVASPAPAPAAVALTAPSGPRLHGHVVDSAGRGVKGARVVATADTASETFDLDDLGGLDGGAGPARPPEAVTGDDGRFVVEALGDAPLFDVVARADGFATRVVSFVRASDEIVITLAPGRRLVGHVLTMDGEPVAGALVSLRDVLGVATVRRDVVSSADGAYRIDAMPDSGSGSVLRTILVTHEGFAPLLVSQAAGGLRRDTDEWTLDLVLGRGATVVGRVVDDETGAAIAAARVVLWSIEANLVARRGLSGASVASPWSPRPLGESVSAADGTFRFEHVPAEGFHPPLASNSGRRGRTLGYVGAIKDGWAWDTDEIPFVREGGSIDAEIRLQRVARVAGRVVESDGKPAVGARVSARVGGARPSMRGVPRFLAQVVPAFEARTDADGRYRLEGVPASTAEARTVTVVAVARREEESDYAPPSREARVTIPLRPGDDATAPDLVLSAPPPASARVVVIVTDAGGAPVWGAWIEPVSSFGSSPYYGLRSDRDGHLVVRLPPRGYGAGGGDLVVRAPDHAGARLALPADATDGTEVRVTLGPSHRVSGRVRRADGTPAASASIAVYASGTGGSPAGSTSPSPIGSGIAAADGAFAIDGLPAGPFELRASSSWTGIGSTSGPGIASRPGVAEDASDIELTLSPETPRPSGRLTGTVVDAETGRPIALFDVKLSKLTASGAATGAPATPKLAASAGNSTLWTFPQGPVATRPSVGRFEAEGLDPGAYDVVVRAEGYLLARVERVAVGEGTTTLPVIRLSRGQRVHGTVSLADGVPRAERVLQFLGPLPLTGRRAGTFAIDASGAYSGSGLLPGRYRVRGETPGSVFFETETSTHVLLATAEVDVPDGAADVALDLRLVPAAALVVQVADARLVARGAPLSDAQRETARGSSLTVLAADGHLVAAAGSLEFGVPLEFADLALLPGAYVVRLVLPGGETIERRVELAAGKRETVVLGARR